MQFVRVGTMSPWSASPGRVGRRCRCGVTPPTTAPACSSRAASSRRASCRRAKITVMVVRPRFAAGADTSTLLVRVSPGERFGRLSFKDLMETASPGDGPGGLTPKRLSSL